MGRFNSSSRMIESTATAVIGVGEAVHSFKLAVTHRQ